MDNIPEMVLVVDAQNRIVDANDAAQKWLQKPAATLVGSHIVDVFSAWPELIRRYQSLNDVREQVQIPGDPSHTFELIISSLYNRVGELEGRIIVAHDISEHKDMEVQLMNVNNSLKIKLAEIEALQEKLRENAIRDPLTGVFNRRYLAETIEGEFARAERDNIPISIIIMDVDHFKQFNDRYGHKCGDLVLQSIGKLLCKNTRRGDIVCRYGGEEFIILLPNAPLSAACQRAEDWRKAFEAMAVEYNGQHLHGTLSAGVASYPLHGATGDAILSAADQALYQSKTNGRNQVAVYSPS
jgi:diguanylate cyclase (GGDEF)-like protein/PAS domain S-box-containing protein